MFEAANKDFTLVLNEPGRDAIAAFDSGDKQGEFAPCTRLLEPKSDAITLLISLPVGCTLTSD
jgi:hypothetical protein